MKPEVSKCMNRLIDAATGLGVAIANQSVELMKKYQSDVDKEKRRLRALCEEYMDD